MEDVETGNGIIVLGPDDSHYVSQVLRMKPGEQLYIVLKDRTDALCEVNRISKDEVQVKVIGTHKNNTEPPFDITLYQSVSKGERMELTIQKCVELGVTKIVPVFSMRCVVRPDEPKKQKAKVQRWQKIALEAARQSGRGIIPEVTEPMTYDEAMQHSKSADSVLFTWEDEHAVTLKQELSGLNREDIKEIAVFIGPEGGYDVKEAQKARDEGARIVTIGKRILRTETAGASVLAMLLYQFEM